jgi:hypothetical protein
MCSVQVIDLQVLLLMLLHVLQAIPRWTLWLSHHATSSSSKQQQLLQDRSNLTAPAAVVMLQPTWPWLQLQRRLLRCTFAASPA